MVKHLIVNADDFGMSENICKGIEHCHAHGIVTSTSLMSNMPSLDLAAEIAKKNKSLSIGLHINLSLSKPLTNFSNGTMTNANLVKAILGRINKDAAQKEIEAQIQAALDAGIKLTHLDGHKHVHIMPKVIDAVIDSALSFNIKWIRLPLEAMSTTYSLKQTPKAKLVRYLSLKAKKKIEDANLKHPNYFYGISETGRLDEEKLKSIIKNLQEGISEIMCHPGYPNQTDSLDRKKELMALTDRGVRKEIEANGIQMTNYGDL